jgi:hypothetical protein
MIDLKALQKQVKLLENGLKPTGQADPHLEDEWRAAKSAQRTAATFETWLGERVTQVAVAWVLSSVFVRFCEDNGLIELPFITGPGERSALAADLQAEFYLRHPESDDRGWLEAAFTALSVSPVAAGLFDRRHNPMWTILPSPHAVKALLDFWRQKGEDGKIRCDLTNPEWNTRFLGDLYQDLSESARKTYALLQTPEFVEKFILKYTLDEAIKEFGLEPEPWGYLRLIDPACGSGHFLLGAFKRLYAAWEKRSPAMDPYDLAARTLESVHGVDKNPFAVAIARFRLMLAAMKAAGLIRLTERVDFPLNIAIGDSLLHGNGAPGRQGQLNTGNSSENHAYRTEDVDNYIKSCRILEVGSYHVVVGNPPYITVKDKAESVKYRSHYRSCYREYSLSVPFAERFFWLSASDGYTGQITANSFMKREFGKRLIEDYFARKIDLTHIIDTSGAYIPGHGTPTVVLFGRQRFPRSNSTIRAVLGIRGEPCQPPDPENGLVWQSIMAYVDDPGTETEWVSVSDVPRDQFAVHPWGIAGGGAAGLRAAIEDGRFGSLGERIDVTGFSAISGSDDAFFLPAVTPSGRVPGFLRMPVVAGGVIRDYLESPDTDSLWPYNQQFDLYSVDSIDSIIKILWPNRRILQVRKRFGIPVEGINGFSWYEYRELYSARLKNPLSIAFAFVATHNHFALDRGGKVFIRTAPVIKLPEGTSEDDHLALLGVLNSSTACFWLHQVSHNKGEGGGARVDAGYSAMGSEAWKNAYEFTGTKLEEFPLPADLPLELGRELDTLAQQLAAVEPFAVCSKDVPTRRGLDAARAEHLRIRGRMIALQEELDWDVYRCYGLITDEQAAESMESRSIPNIELGHRAFEIILARRIAKGELTTEWFSRFGGKQITDIPVGWPESYRKVVEKRIGLIERNRNIGLIERPECKRRWQSDTWESKEQAALGTWLLDRCEERSLWYNGNSPRPMTVNRLADRLRADADVVSVARLLAGPDADLADVLREIIAAEHVPFVAQYRYKPSGLDKRRQWERTWDLQRQEDATSERLDIDVPPKYTNADFQKSSYWRHRGKLDVPKERFISYPCESPDSDKDSLLLGWAGWDHREQAAALITLIEERSTIDGWDTPRLMALLAGLLEVMPWVRQWHSEIVPEFGDSYANAYDGYLISQRESRSLAEDDLRAWGPRQGGRGRRTTPPLAPQAAKEKMS